MDPDLDWTVLRGYRILKKVVRAVPSLGEMLNIMCSFFIL